MIILPLSDKVLREVAKEDIAVVVWLNFEILYMTKSLANKLHKKTRLYTFKMAPSMSIDEHHDEFDKIILDLAKLILT